jgi:ribosomal protein RSM22 (predicted rRNA methylase)
VAGGLPEALEAAAARLIEGVSRKGLAERFSRIAEQYRRGGASHPVVVSEADVAAYVFSRLPGTYAAAETVFEKIAERAPGFAPRRVLDVGAGPGGASWAAAACWPSLEAFVLIDANPAFLAAARTLAAESGVAGLAGAAQIAGDFTRLDAPAADLVIASYALAEIEEAKVGPTAARLWRACEGVLVLIEPGTPAGFARILAARAALIAEGAHVLAPCPHDGVCRMQPPDWCHVTRRVARSRDHKLVKGASRPFEDEAFAYIAASRFPAERRGARVVSSVRLSKVGAGFTACTAQGLERRTVPSRDRAAFAKARRLDWGDWMEEG